MKKNRYTMMLVVFILLAPAIKPQIYEGNLTLNNQAAVDSFNYTEVTGNLFIMGPDITNLDGLSELQVIGLCLHIDNNPILTSIAGLSGLDSIKGEFNFEDNTFIRANPLLTNLDGLSNLKFLKVLEISHNASLQNIDGLSGLTELDAINIEDNPSLTNINGLLNVTNISPLNQSIINNSSLVEFCGLYVYLNSGNYLGSLQIAGNGANPDVNDILKQGPCFPIEFTGDVTLTTQAEVNDFNYTKVTGNLTVEGDSINNIDGLLELDSVGGNFNIRNNNNLTNIYGIRYLRAVGGDLSITSNPMIPILLNFDEFTSLGGNLIIQNNANLDEFCGLYPLFAAGYSGSISISGNKSNPSRSQIEGNGSCSDFIYFGFLKLSTQAQIDTFHYKQVIGGLEINGSSPGNITNVNGLSELKAAQFLWIFNNNSLINLSGLENLSSIDGLNILRNEKLADINSLTGITSLIDLNIEENDSLENIDGLSNLTKISRIAVRENAALKNIDAFSGITFFDQLSVALNPSLQNIDGLASVDSVTTRLDIRGLPLLTNINPLSNLVYVGNEFRLQVTGIQNINSLTKLRYVGRLFILVNSNLAEYCGLYPLLTEGFVGQFDISFNLVNPSKQHIIDNGPCGESSDSIFVGNLFLTSQSQIDKFSYDVVTGHLCVAESHDGNIKNINGLARLKSVGPFLIVGNDSLKNLDSLYNLTSAYTIEIKDNTSLTKFCGLYNLVHSNGISSSQPVIEGNANNPTIKEIEEGGPCTEQGNDGSLTGVTGLNIPTVYSLNQNYPNPFNPTTIIKYSLPEAQFVKLNVYNALGEVVRTLVNGSLNAGEYETLFDASGLPSGMYIYRIEAGSFTDTKKLLLIK